MEYLHKSKKKINILMRTCFIFGINFCCTVGFVFCIISPKTKTSNRELFFYFAAHRSKNVVQINWNILKRTKYTHENRRFSFMQLRLLLP